MQRSLALTALALTVTACATTADSERSARELDQALAGRVPGEPVDCIDPFNGDGPRIIGDHTLLYGSGRRVWRNTIEACPSLSSDRILIVERHGSQLCRNDMFRVAERGSVVPGPYCRLGRFVPYDRPKR